MKLHGGVAVPWRYISSTSSSISSSSDISDEENEEELKRRNVLLEEELTRLSSSTLAVPTPLKAPPRWYWYRPFLSLFVIVLFFLSIFLLLFLRSFLSSYLITFLYSFLLPSLCLIPTPFYLHSLSHLPSTSLISSSFPLILCSRNSKNSKINWN